MHGYKKFVYFDRGLGVQQKTSQNLLRALDQQEKLCLLMCLLEIAEIGSSLIVLDKLELGISSIQNAQ